MLQWQVDPCFPGGHGYLGRIPQIAFGITSIGRCQDMQPLDLHETSPVVVHYAWGHQDKPPVAVNVVVPAEEA